jgi:hypothetical protein
LTRTASLFVILFEASVWRARRNWICRAARRINHRRCYRLWRIRGNFARRRHWRYWLWNRDRRISSGRVDADNVLGVDRRWSRRCCFWWCFWWCRRHRIRRSRHLWDTYVNRRLRLRIIGRIIRVECFIALFLGQDIIVRPIIPLVVSILILFHLDEVTLA